MRWFPWLVLVVLIISPILPAQEKPAPAPEAEEAPLDIMTVSAADLVGVDTRKLIGEAHAAYNEKRYEDAARAYIKALKHNPGDSTALYNLACCYGLLGAEAQALDFLGAAYKAGFRDVEHIRRDPDFAKVRDSAVFQTLIDSLDERATEEKAAKGDVVWVPSTRLVAVRIVKPKDVKPWERLPLLIGLHGLGDNAENFAQLLRRRGIEGRFFFAVPDAVFPFARGNQVGYSWFLGGEDAPARDVALSHDLNSRFVLDVLEAVKKEVPVDATKVFLMGFSQGAGMTLSVGLAHPEYFRGLIPIGGWLDRGGHSRAQLAAAAKTTRVLLCHSPGDRVVEFARAKEAEAHLEPYAMPLELFTYEGGHTLPKLVLEKMVEWMGKE